MIQLKLATTEDIGLIRDIAEKTWFITYGEILSQAQMDYMFEWMYSIESLTNQMQELHHHFFLAYRDEKPMGFVSIEKQDENLFHLHKLYLLPEAQGLGIGKALINQAFEFAKKNTTAKTCALELKMNRQNKALGFYQKMGMYISGAGDFDIGNGYFMNDYIFRKDL